MLSYAVPYWQHLLVAVVTLTTLTVLGMVNPYFSGMLVDRVLKGGEKQLLLPICGGMLLVALARGVLRYIKGCQIERVGQGVIYDLRVSLYAHLQRLSFSYYDKVRTGELMSRLTGDVEALRVFFSDGILNLYECALTLVVVMVILLKMNTKLTLLCLSMSPFLAWVVFRFDSQIRPAYSHIRRQNASLSAVVQENIAGVRVVKAFAREQHEIDKFARENEKLWERVVYSADVRATYIPIMDLLSGFSSVAVLWYGGYQVIQGNLTLGSFVAFNSYIWSLIWPIRRLGHLVNLLEQALAAAERLFEILDTQPAIASPAGAVSRKVRGKVEFRNVNLHYGSADVLQDINLVVEPGTTVAIVGATGSGKTSLVNLIPRFYDVTGGQVLVDDVDVRDWDLGALRKHIGIALQETFLFSMPVGDNIAFGRQDASQTDIEAAAQAAQAHAFISDLPEGYDTFVGERGIGLSGGQRQRVAIARALLTDPRILILDDATSSVDMETEHRIQIALRSIMQGRTTFIIAHRLATVKDADIILVMENGRIVAQGTHDSLLLTSAIYNDIYQEQYREQERLRDLVQATGTTGGGVVG